KLQQGTQPLADLAVTVLAQPGARKLEAAVARQNEISEDERCVLRDPVDLLVPAVEHDLDAGRHLAERAVVPLRQLGCRTAVVLDGDEHTHRPARTSHVAVERLEEPVAVLHRHQRVEEHDRLRRLVVVAAHLLLPTVGPALGRRPGRMEAGPAPESGCKLLDAHAASILAGRDTTGRSCMTRFRTLALLGALAGTLVVVAPSNASKTALPKLTGTVGPGFTISMKRLGKPFKVIKPGSYSITVADKSNIHNFRLRGPGVNREITTVSFVGTKTVIVRVRKGQYTFVCDPHATIMKGSFT